jgi:hypothetical protein
MLSAEPKFESTPTGLDLLANAAYSLPALDLLAIVAYSKPAIQQPISSPPLSTLSLKSLWNPPSKLERLDQPLKSPQDPWVHGIRESAPLAAPNVRLDGSMAFDERLKRFIPRLPPTPPLEFHDLAYEEDLSHFGPERKKAQGVKLVCSYRDCGKTFNHKSNVKSHLLTHCSEKPFTCSISNCKSRFARKHDLQRHWFAYFLSNLKGGMFTNRA